MWNSLPDSVVMADTVNQFKNRLDKHWANYYTYFCMIIVLTITEPEACLLGVRPYRPQQDDIGHSRKPYHIITSHGENGSRPQRSLYPRNNDRVHFILHKILYYNTTVSDAKEICFVIIHHVLIDPEFI